MILPVEGVDTPPWQGLRSQEEDQIHGNSLPDLEVVNIVVRRPINNQNPENFY